MRMSRRQIRSSSKLSSGLGKLITQHPPTNKTSQLKPEKPSTSKTVSISNYFQKDEEQKAKFNDSRDDDFMSPLVLKKQLANNSKWKLNVTPKQKSRKVGKKMKNATLEIVKENFSCNGENPDHLQMAIALSKSSYESEYGVSLDDVSKEQSTPDIGFILRNSKPTNLEKFGFRTDRLEACKKGKTRFKYITPVLNIRTQEQRESIIESKISDILVKSVRKTPEQSSVFTLHGSKLWKYSIGEHSIFHHEGDNYYVEELNLTVYQYKCGSLLRDWSTIPGRDKSPERYKGDLKTGENKSPALASCRSVSPDLFESDDELCENFTDTIGGEVIDITGDNNEETKKSSSSKPSSFYSLDEFENAEVMETTKEEIDDIFLVSEKKGQCKSISNKVNKAFNNLTRMSLDDSLPNQHSENNQNVHCTYKTLDKDIFNTSLMADDCGIFSSQSEVKNQIMNSEVPLDQSIYSTIEHVFSNHFSGIEVPDDKCSYTNNINKTSEINSSQDFDHSVSYERTKFDKSLPTNIGSGNHRSITSHGCNGDVGNESGKHTISRKQSSFYSLDDSDPIELNKNEVNIESVDEEIEKQSNIESASNNQPSECIEISDDSSSSHYFHSVSMNTIESIRSESFETKVGINNVGADKNDKKYFEKTNNALSRDYDEKLYSLSSTSFNMNDLIHEDFSEESEDSNTEIKQSPYKGTSWKGNDLKDICSPISKRRKSSSGSSVEILDDTFKAAAFPLSESQSKENTSTPKRSLDLGLNKARPSYEYYDAELNVTDYVNNILNHAEDEESTSSQNSSLKDEELNYSSHFGTLVTSEPDLYPDADNSDDEYPVIYPSKSPVVPSLSKSPLNSKTPTNYRIKTTNVTPMPNFDQMTTPVVNKELDKVGVKPLKRARGIQLLKYIYESTHPLVGSVEQTYQENDPSDDGKVIKRRKKNCEEVVEVSFAYNGESQIDIVGNELLENERPEDLIFERRRSTTIPSCQVPLQIIWHNFLSCNPRIKRDILLYEPLELQSLHLMLKGLGFKFHIRDLLTFLDKKCITVRTPRTQRK